MDLETRIELISKLGGAFSPSAPVHQKALFAGRMAQLMAVVTAVEQRGQHVVLFGERGVGKTSLATIITRIYEGRANVAGCRSINCDPTMSFAKLWNSILREMTYEVETPAAGFTGEATKSQKSLASEVPPKPTPDDVRHLLSKLGQTIIVIDELDRLTDTTATGMIADTIKTLSDHDVQTTLILVGVADSIDALIAQHQSVERALVQIRMPRMSQEELHQILDVGYGMVGLTADNDAKARIATLSQGLPDIQTVLL